MACRARRDEHGTTYYVPEAPVQRRPGGQMAPGIPQVQVWWSHGFRGRIDETLIIRQENAPDKADVIELTLGQVYDLIHALGWAIMRP